ncbi:MAG: YncE family protein, partial [Chloroflexota bacterium]
MYAGASTTAGYDNRLYDTEPMAVDTSLGRAVVISGMDGPGEAQIIDLTTRRVLRTLTVGTQPINVQVDTALHRAYILDNGSCEVNILDLRSGRLVANVAVGPGPLGLAVNEPTGKVFVTQGVGKLSHVLMFPAATTLDQQGCD